MTDVSAFPGGLPTDYRVHLEWVRHSAEGATIDAFDLTWAPYGDRIRETLVPFYIADDGSGLLTLTDAGMAELTANWAAKADTSFANVTVAGTLAVQGEATFACNEMIGIDGPAGTTRDIFGSTLGVFRWGIELGSSAAEVGSNGGSHFAIDRYNDAGTLIDQPFTINRATGMATFISPAKFPSNATIAASNPSGLDGIQIDGPALSGLAIGGQRAGSLRWRLVLGQGTAESGSNAGSDFTIARYTDAGALIDNPLTINRAGGGITINIPANAVSNLPRLDAVAGLARNWMYTTAGVLRWSVGANQTAEGGSNAGSDFTFNRYTDAGALIDSPLQLNRASGLVTFRCTAAADNAPAGFIGEVISSNVTTGVALTTAVAANVTSIALTAGDWDVQGEVWISIGTGGATAAHAGINTTTAALPAASALNTARETFNMALAASTSVILSLRSCRVSIAATTTFFLVAQCSFPSGAPTATGNIWARRSR